MFTALKPKIYKYILVIILNNHNFINIHKTFIKHRINDLFNLFKMMESISKNDSSSKTIVSGISQQSSSGDVNCKIINNNIT